MKVGDSIKIEFTNAFGEPTGESVEGVLTYLSDDEPYCEVDGVGYDLATECCSSIIKVIHAI